MVQRENRRDKLAAIRSAAASGLKRLKIDKEVTDNFLRSIPLWIGSLIVGVVAVLYARLFAAAETLGRQIFSHTSWLLFIVTPVCFIAAWLIVRYGAPLARGSGIPQVLAALEISGTDQNRKVQFLTGGKIIAVKIVSSIVMVFGGGAVGREGPTIQISAAIFRLVGKYLPEHWPRFSERVMIMTGGAAGLAAAFNTPLGGIVFAIEELSKSHFTAFRTSLLTAVIIAGMTAQMLLGPYLYLGYPQVDSPLLSMIGLLLLTAVACGIIGAIVSDVIVRIILTKKWIRTLTGQGMFVAGLAFSLAAAAYFFTPSVLGSGKETMLGLLFGTGAANDILLVPARIVGPLLSFTSGAAGGIFAPALSTGAAVGGTLASFFSLPPQQANVLILAGMAAFLSAVTRSPFTSAILVLEMTDRHSLIFFLMLAGLISYTSAWMVNKRSLYERLKEDYFHDLAVRIETEEKHRDQQVAKKGR